MLNRRGGAIDTRCRSQRRSSPRALEPARKQGSGFVRRWHIYREGRRRGRTAPLGPRYWSSRSTTRHAAALPP